MDPREALRAQSLVNRFNDAKDKLKVEREVRDYLSEQGKAGAVRHVDENIRRMEKTVEKFRNDLIGPEMLEGYSGLL